MKKSLKHKSIRPNNKLTWGNNIETAECIKKNLQLSHANQRLCRRHHFASVRLQSPGYWPTTVRKQLQLRPDLSLPGHRPDVNDQITTIEKKNKKTLSEVANKNINSPQSITHCHRSFTCLYNFAKIIGPWHLWSCSTKK